MVKKLFFAAVSVAFILTVVLVGCAKNNNPVIPAGSAVLQLVIPSKILNAVPSSKLAKIGAKASVPDSGQGILEYYLVADGQAPITGQITYASGSEVGNVIIPLPQSGNWVVSAEWFYLFNVASSLVPNAKKVVAPTGYTAEPEFVGADMVNVQGTTPFTLNMEDIGYQEYNCYISNLTDPLNTCDYPPAYTWVDLFSFDSGIQSASVTAGTTGDVQALFDVTTQSTYLSGPYPFANSPLPVYTYLGNGDLVNFPVVPNNAIFYPDTIHAKAAAGQSPVTLMDNDVYAVKVPSTHGMAWVQPYIVNANCGTSPSALLQFRFVYNKEGLNYMKFDETTNGLANCNLNP